MIRRVIFLLPLLGLTAWGQCSSPCVASAINWGATTFSLSSISTTGATFIGIGKTYLTTNEPVLSDSLGNSPACLTAQSSSANGQSTRICYMAAPTVGASDVFTLTATGNFYGTLAVAAFSGVEASPYHGLLNGTNIAGPTTAYQPGSVTPNAAGDLVLSGISAGVNGGSSLTIGSGFAITNQHTYVGGNNFGGGLAYLVSPAGAAVNPTWTDNTSEGAALTIASFSQASAAALTVGGPLIF